MYIHAYIDIWAKYFENQSYMYMYMYLIDHTCTNNWRTRLIGHCNRCSYWLQHAPTCSMIQMKSMSRRCKVCSLFFACIIWYFPKYCLLLCRVLYHPTVARLHTRLCLRSHSTDCCRGTYCSGARHLGRIRVRGWGTRYMIDGAV